MANFVGQRLGQYEILSRFGEGGMATVYRARQLNIKRDVAIKVILPSLAAKDDFYKRFDKEAQTIAALSNPHIVKVFDYGVMRGFHLRLLDGQADPRRDIYYIVMEILTGGSLSNLLAKGPVPLPRISRILDQIGNALDYAHARDIVHRDLKPPNVLFDDQENAFLTDFGIAKLLGDTTTLTKEGMTMGTPSYMSPEQWADDNLGGWTDIYAMGVLLFEMLTGKLPFTAGTPFRVMHMHLNDKPPSLYTLRPNLPPGLDEVIGRALAKKPEDRPPSATDLAEHFKSVIAPHVPLGSGAYPRPTPTSANVSVASSTEPAKVNGLPAQPASAPPEHSQQVTGFERVLDMSFGGGPGKAATQRLVVVGAIIAVLVMLLVVVLLAVR